MRTKEMTISLEGSYCTYVCGSGLMLMVFNVIIILNKSIIGYCIVY
jgi:hypothetical protein